MNQYNQMFQPQLYGNPYQNRATNPTMFQANNGITWVQGIEGAKAWQLPPNSNTLLMDSENDGVFYIKVSDNVGMCTLRTFKYSEVVNEPVKHDIDLSQYVTKDELKGMLEELKNEQPVQSVKPTTKSKSTITE